MNSFDLSLAMPAKTGSEVQASKKYDTKIDPKTNEPVKQTVTEGGVNINKAQAPEIMLSGPLGYKYTKLLDTELSLENMSAVVAAAAGSASGLEDVNDPPPGTPGFVAMSSTGPIVEDDNDNGYIFVTAADTLESKDLSEISQNFMDKRLKNPKRRLGLAMITEGKPSATMEALHRVMTSMNIPVTTAESGLFSMIASMKKEAKNG